MAVQVNVTIDFGEAARQLAAFQQELGAALVSESNQAEQAFQQVASQAAQNVQRQAAQITQGVQTATQGATQAARTAGKNMTEEFLRAFDPDKIRAELQAAGLDEQQIDIIIDTTQARAETQKLKDSIATALGEASGIAEESLKQITAQVAREVDRAAGKVKSVTEIVDGVRDIKKEMNALASATNKAGQEGESASVKLFDIEKAEQYVTAIGDVKDVIEGVANSFGGLTEAQSATLEKTTSLAQAMGGLGSIAGPLGALIGAGLGGAIGYFTSQSANAIQETRNFREQMQSATDAAEVYKDSLQQLAIEILSTGRLTAATLSSTIAAQQAATGKRLQALASDSKTTKEQLEQITEDLKTQGEINLETLAKTAKSISETIVEDANNLAGLYDSIDKDKYDKSITRANTYYKKIKSLEEEAIEAAAKGRTGDVSRIASDLAQIEALYNANYQGILKLELESKERYEKSQESKSKATSASTKKIEENTEATEDNAKAIQSQVRALFEAESIASKLASKTKLAEDAFVIEPKLKIPPLDKEDMLLALPSLDFASFVDITKYIEEFEDFAVEIQDIFREQFEDKALNLSVAIDPESQKQAEKDLQDVIKNAEQVEKQRQERADYAIKIANERRQKEAEDALAQAEQLLRPLEDVTMSIFDTMLENIALGKSAFADLGAAIRDSIFNALKAIGKEYAVKAIGETAQGLAALAIGGPFGAKSASEHFAAAASFAAAAVAAGVGAAAVGAGSKAAIPGGGGGSASLGGAGGGGSPSLGAAANGASNQPTAAVVVDFRGAMFPTSDLRAAQEFGAAVAGYIDSAYKGGAISSRPRVGR